jgi:hypothetical protein
MPLLFHCVAQYLSLDINWNYYKPEQKEEYLRELEGLVKSDYSSLSDAEKKAGKFRVLLVCVCV